MNVKSYWKNIYLTRKKYTRIKATQQERLSENARGSDESVAELYRQRGLGPYGVKFSVLSPKKGGRFITNEKFRPLAILQCTLLGGIVHYSNLWKCTFFFTTFLLHLLIFFLFHLLPAIILVIMKSIRERERNGHAKKGEIENRLHEATLKARLREEHRRVDARYTKKMYIKTWV